MNKLLIRLKFFYSKIASNIAFYPSVIAIIGALFGFFMVYAEAQGISKYLIEHAPTLVINDADTARVILSTFIGGVFTLMVFSFSMVMLLLNQASNNYSPRILPGLISNKRHQYVLGFFIAVIIYCIIVLLSIEPTEDKYQLPGFAVLVGIILGVLVLAAFIYFIHSISQSIQINNITERIYSVAQERMIWLIDKEEEDISKHHFSDTDSWTAYKTKKSGQLNDIALDALADLCKEADCMIEILVPKGIFLLEGTPLVKINKELNEPNQEKLYACFGFSRSEVVKNNYVLGFKQLTEIALKAMSPGINDPGTAITCIDYLTELFALRMQRSDQDYMANEDKVAVVKLKTVDFSELLYFIYASLRQYCKHDIILMIKITKSLLHLYNDKKCPKDSREEIKKQILLILEDAQEHITNKYDLEQLNSMTQCVR